MLSSTCDNFEMTQPNETSPPAVVSINEADIAKNALAVKQILVDEFKSIVYEKQRPNIDELL